MKYYDCNAETGTNDIILSVLLCTRTSYIYYKLFCIYAKLI